MNMYCPKCQEKCTATTNKTDEHISGVCFSRMCVFYSVRMYFINPDDIINSFWKNTYLIEYTRVGIPFVINADYEQQAIDEMIDYIETEEWNGLLLDYNDSDDQEMIESGEYICGGNHSRYLSSYHIRIESL